MPNSQIAVSLNLNRHTVRKWRDRFVEAQHRLAEMERAGFEDKELEAALQTLVDDAARPGGPTKFEPEEVVSIVQLACTDPEDFGIPISHWTPEALAKQAVEENIVESISPTSVRRFLKRS